MPARTSRATSHRDDQIVVATGHTRPVKEALHRWGVRLSEHEEESIAELGLTKLVLPSLRADVGPMRQDIFLVRTAESAAAERRPRGAASTPVDDLDLLMFRLRFDFGYRSGGWVPVIGKNRYVETTEALGEIGGGGAGVPQLVAQGEIGGGGGGAPQVLAEGEIGGGGVSLPRAIDIERANGGVKGLRLADGRLIDRESPAGSGKRVVLFDTPVWLHKEFTESHCKHFVTDRAAIGTGAMAGHGVFGAGLILRAAPQTELISVPILDDDGSAEVWTVAQQIVAYLHEDNPVDIIHMPWGAITPDGEEPLVLAVAVRALSRAGIELVAAAGNHGDSDDPAVLRNAPSYPAALPEVTAVAAAVRPEVAARFSPDPDDAPWIDVLRPGQRLVSTYLDDGYALWGGSSFASALYVGERVA